MHNIPLECKWRCVAFVVKVFDVRGAQEEEKKNDRERMQVKHARHGNTYSTKLGATDVK